MAEERAKRKLSAILSADVKGYSRLMGEDELATIETLKKYREVMAALINRFQGRVVDSPGDNVLAEFSSVVDALECSVEVQKELKQKNEELPENRRMEFRVGVNLGDVVEDGERIYGDGVNIAARVESLAEGGGICISGTAFDQIGKKLAVGYEYLGEQTVKNIEKPVRVYRVLMEPEAVGRVIGQERPRPRPWRNVVMAAVVALVLVAAALTIWSFYFRAPRVEPASVERMAFPLPEKPSIAVLAFTNMSGDPEQEYFSDGLSEEIITTLSKASDLFVIARQSTFSYKGKPVMIKQVAEDLGVRYVLQGSVRKGEDRVRVTAQLIDALTGRHLWAEGYDRELKDILAVQGEITKEIITALEVKLTKGEQARVFARGTDNVEAWALGAKAWKLCVEYSKENMAKAREILEQALKLDPDYAFLWTAQAHTHFVDARFGWTKSRGESYKRALECAKKAITLNEEDPFAHAYTGNIYLLQRQHEKAIAAGQRAISIDPNYADGYVMLSQIMLYSGRFEEALALIEKGIRLCPIPRVFYPYVLAHVYVMLGRHEEAIATNKHLLERCRKGECPPWFGKAGLITSYMELGKEEEARAEAEELLRLNPRYSLEFPRKNYPFKDPAHLERYLSALRRAGIPDKPPLPLPDKPSIAVLPFANMSDDPKQEYFADGMTDDLITDLSKISGLFVIARNSVFTYKGKVVKPQQISRELGIRYVLEGSVRKADDRVRINAQLIDATTGGHLWAERYDGELGDVFALQDKVTQKIVAALAVKLTLGEQEQIARKYTDNMAAYDAFLQGREHYRRYTPDDFAEAVRYFKKAVELDPNYGRAYAMLAKTYWDWYKSFGGYIQLALMHEAEMYLQKAMNNPTSIVYQVASSMHIFSREHEKAIAEAQRAIALDPNDGDSYHSMAYALICAGRPKEALDFVAKAMRLDPHYPAYYLFVLGLAQFSMEQFEEAATSFERALKRNPEHYWLWFYLAASYGHLGRKQEAAAAIEEYKKIRAGVSIKGISSSPMSARYKDPADKDRLLEGLRKAGLPETFRFWEIPTKTGEK